MAAPKPRQNELSLAPPLLFRLKDTCYVRIHLFILHNKLIYLFMKIMIRWHTTQYNKNTYNNICGHHTFHSEHERHWILILLAEFVSQTLARVCALVTGVVGWRRRDILPGLTDDIARGKFSFSSLWGRMREQLRWSSAFTHRIALDAILPVYSGVSVSAVHVAVLHLETHNKISAETRFFDVLLLFSPLQWWIRTWRIHHRCTFQAACKNEWTIHGLLCRLISEGRSRVEESEW